MAEQLFIDLFRSVDGQMTNLSTTMGAQGVAKIVEKFDGSKPKEFKDWIKSIEKFGDLTRVPAERTKFIAYQASRGPVSDFIKRYMENHGDHTWVQIKAELKLRFGEVVDAQHARLLLRRVRQKPFETVQVYAERMLNLGEDAFEGLDQRAVQAELIGYFVDGLRENPLKLKIMRENPADFQAAVAVATREQNLYKRFQLRTGLTEGSFSSVSNNELEPMDVSHLRNKVRCHYCKRMGHVIKECRARKRDRNMQVSAVRQSNNKNRSNVVCYNCRDSGHYARECPKRKYEAKVANAPLNGNSSQM